MNPPMEWHNSDAWNIIRHERRVGWEKLCEICIITEWHGASRVETETKLSPSSQRSVPCWPFMLSDDFITEVMRGRSKEKPEGEKRKERSHKWIFEMLNNCYPGSGCAELSECLMTKLFPVPGWKFVNCPILVVRGEREDAGWRGLTLH